MASREVSTNRLQSIEALRGLAALSVAWFHLTNTYASNFTRYSGHYGWLGVECFFVISGFVIPYSLYRQNYRPQAFVSFLIRRIARLEPAYLASIALGIALWELSSRAPGFAGAPPNYSAWQIASHLFYLVPLTGQQWLSPVYWTLAYEFVFYIFMGLTYPYLMRSIWYCILSAIFACIAYRLLFGDINGMFLLFLVGTAAMRFHVGIDRPILTVLVISAAAIGIAFTITISAAVVATGTACAILFVKWTAPRPIIFLGTISYSLYLVHVPIGGRVVNLGGRLGSAPMYEFALSLLAMAVSICAAWVLYRVIEVPSLELSRSVKLAPRPALSSLGS